MVEDDFEERLSDIESRLNALESAEPSVRIGAGEATLSGVATDLEHLMIKVSGLAARIEALEKR